MPDLKSELMKLDNLKFDDDVSGEQSPIMDKAEIKRMKQREYNARWKAKQKAKLQTTTKRALAIPATSLTKSPSAEQLVNTMSVGLAKAVYLELKKVFEA